MNNKRHTRTIFSLKGKSSSSLFSIAVIAVIFGGVIVLAKTSLNTTSPSVGNSELRYKEISMNPKMKGSVLPASCESYPSVGATHAIDGHGGHCGGTCPATYSINVRPYYRECSYVQGFCGIDCTPNIEYVEVSVTQSCPAFGPMYGYNLSTNDVVNVPLCSKQCPNGTWAYPHAGILCPAAAPTDSVYFN